MKKPYRQLGINQLKTFAEEASDEKTTAEEDLYHQLFTSEFWKEAKVVGLTMSLPFEVATDPIITQGLREGKVMAIPKSEADHTLTFVKVTADTSYIMSEFGVAEPATGELIASERIDHLLVPGILFRRDGYRIGFGGGYYDRLLVNYSGETASLLFNFQINEEWRPQEFDQPVAQLFISNQEGTRKAK